MTVAFPFENFTRAPFEVGWSPLRSGRTPAFASSSLYAVIASMISSPGSSPASDSSFAGTNTMNLGIAVSFPSGSWARSLRDRFEPYAPVVTTNDGRRDRHRPANFHGFSRLSLSLIRPCFPRTLTGYRTAPNSRDDHPRQAGGDRCAHPPPGCLVGSSGHHLRGAGDLRRLPHVGCVPGKPL